MSVAFCQDSTLYRVTKKTRNNINCIHPESIEEIIFDGSVIKNLDNKWSKFINVKRITFANHSRIPTNLHIFANADKLSFANYDSIYFPSDFPYSKFINLSIVGIMKPPSELKNFKNLETIFCHEIGGIYMIDYLVNLKNIKSVIISAIQAKINTDFCSLDQLEKLHLHNVKFGSGSLNLICLKRLRFLYISESNLSNLILENNLLKCLKLENNEISEKRIQELNFLNNCK